MTTERDSDRFGWSRWLRRDRSRLGGDAGDATARDPVAAPELEARTVAIASGKGGTGKSFLATNLAICAARRGLRTTLIDCDYGLAVDHLLLGVHAHRNLQSVLEGSAGARSCRLETPFGIRLVAGATGVSEFAHLGPTELDRLAAAFGVWGRDQDLLVIDTGAGLAGQSLATLAAADHVVLVVQPEIASLTDAYALVKCLVRNAGPAPSLSVVANRITVPQHALAAHRRLDAVTRRFLDLGLGYLGVISEEPAVSPRRLGQPPLVVSHPACRTAREIGTILDALQAALGGMRARPVADGAGIEARFRAGLARHVRP